jgi:hypothetical protein
MQITENWPDIGRADAGAVSVTEWSVGAVDLQEITANTLINAWQREDWPEGLMSMNLFASTDGKTLLNYAQWATCEACEKFAGALDEAVQYRLHRSRARDAASIPGCVVIVSVEFDGPDEARQRRWIDLVFDALDSEPQLPPGGISGHFHISTDGTRVLNYAEWITPEAHRAALENSGQGTVGRGPKWLEVRNFPGIKANSFKRYKLIRSLYEGKG